MKFKLKSIFFPILMLFVMNTNSCSEKNRPESTDEQLLQKEDLMNVNRFLAGKDMELINAYISRRKWDMDFSKTGLGYQIYEHGKGMKVEPGNTVTLEYTQSLIDGRICYSSEEDGHKIFKVGQGGVEAGLEEGVLMLREGDKARFILPPFLAHGLIGDQNRVPPRAIIIYEINLLNISEK